MTRKIKAIIFDYDNTLLEFHPYEAEADLIILDKIARKYKLNPRDLTTELNKIKNKHVHNLAKPEEFSRILWLVELYGKFRIPEDLKEINKLVDKYWYLIRRKAKLFPTVKNTLEQLKGKYKLAIFSDSDGNKQIKLKRIKAMNIEKYFDKIFTSDDFGYNKPEKSDFNQICDSLGVHPKECMMVGDSNIRDLKPAKKLGLTTVWTQEAYRDHTPSNYADFTIFSMIELLDILKDMEK
ncbi:HAD family hydrolase [Candidatus Woesearchaeota archaeon]|nr:HAD family hydrolase [Candidatus Woesearchaeota archaeon]